jgi:hypothetical protein
MSLCGLLGAGYAPYMSIAEQRVQDVPPSQGHAVDQEPPLGGYAALIATFGALVGGFTFWHSQSGRELPEHVPARDLLLVAMATFKASRLIAKDRVTSTARAPFTELEDGISRREAPRGRGLRRAVGELILCPHCLGVWIAAAFAAALIVAPRPTRWITAVFSAALGVDVLQLAYKKAEDAR